MTTKRLAVLDLARGLAVVAMAIYHFSWDLSWFAFVDWPVSQGTGWRIFAASIAGSFLFLAGVSLDLAHNDRIRWQAFGRRLAMIVVAAAAVSLVTYFTFGDSFVRFGILHSIALASLIALPFTRAPLILGAGASIVFLTLPLWAKSPTFDGSLWLWTGLGTAGYPSVDYVPMAPWTGITLAGLAVSRTFRALKLWTRLSEFRLNSSSAGIIRLMGRHSLAIYLLHQPVLYGLVWSAAAIGPDMDRSGKAFVRNCSLACEDSLGTPGICRSACSCTLEQMKSDNIWDALQEDPQNQSLRSRMNTSYAQCLADAELAPQDD
ncbi:heparan-alpha-glucosaminide N-acetyltransferase [Roseibium porphyridii]|uniref:Heparan-alpha-glucosaminide N-acetyltransferase n=1 Tax=Roseibium porphyridii TaxID=2866279 RepID=A0ABY8F7Q7_9HYPH|nr:heparan-alpha-glucosaminide N-acetyltransferase [Roseibium sp. KMA01]WFE91481.1 heparan-alpha-glucosaminide N-acetyltransferase [Roseibium sp. KMA01]